MQQSGENQESRPPVPPFNEETARQKVKAAQDADGKHAERLLEAIERHGGVSPAKAAIEAGLSVEEADGILSGLAQKGYLEVRVEEGKLVYGM
jgi:predicted ArsR family transcriptional regulator